MKLDVDSNVIIAGVLRNGVTRKLLMEAPIAFESPEWMLGEIRRHRRSIASRAGLSQNEFDLLLALLTKQVEVIPATTYQGHIEDATTRIGARDMGEVPFVALALASKCDGVWTHNQKHFESAGVRV